MHKHTPGPWVVSTAFGSVGAIQHMTGFIAFPCAPRSALEDRMDGESWLDMRNRTEQARKDIEEEEAANRRLLAAAPDLLEALKRCRFDSLNMSLADLEFCRMAFVKATGGAA